MKLVALLLVVMCACRREPPPRVSVGAAAVLRHAMPELVARHRARAGTIVDVVYGASDNIATLPLDVLVLAERGAFGTNAMGEPRTIATTSLVLVGPAGSPHRFATLRDEGVVAIGEPKTVPVGRYARAYLQQLGVWDAVSPRTVLGGDVAGVLALAQRGTTHVAIVYATDVADAEPLVMLDRATDGPAVEVAASVTRQARGPAAAQFVQFLQSPDARAILARHGFGDVVR